MSIGSFCNSLRSRPDDRRRLSSPRRQSDKGAALIVVVWGVGLASLLALAFVNRLHTETLVSRNLVSSAEAEIAANTGVTLALGMLPALRQRLASDASGMIKDVVLTFECRTPDGHRLKVAVSDEAGKVDLNTADERLLRALLSGFGASDNEASKVVDRIVDFRDQDDLRRLNGAEAREYQLEGAAFGPKNAPFESIDELEQVLGLRNDLYAAIRPHITVFQRGTGIDPGASSAELRRALGLPPRQSAIDSTNAADPSSNRMPFPPDLIIRSTRRAFSVRSRAVGRGGSIYIRSAVVELVDRPGLPFVIRRWQRDIGGSDDRMFRDRNAVSEQEIAAPSSC